MKNMWSMASWIASGVGHSLDIAFLICCKTRHYTLRSRFQHRTLHIAFSISCSLWNYVITCRLDCFRHRALSLRIAFWICCCIGQHYTLRSGFLEAYEIMWSLAFLIFSGIGHPLHIALLISCNILGHYTLRVRFLAAYEISLWHWSLTFLIFCGLCWSIT